MDFGKLLANPIVLIAGGGLGLVLMLKGGASRGSAQAVDPYSAAIAAMPFQVQMNTAALGAQTEQTQIAADHAASMYSLNVQDHAQVLSYLSNVNNNETQLDVQRSEAQSGIVNSIITTAAATQQNLQDNTQRMAATYVSRDIAQINATSADTVARYQYKGAKAAANATLFGGIAKAVGSVAQAALI
jgi:hypothetical protein